MSKKTAAVLIIGDEILSGRTLDTNTQTIAKMLGEIGVSVVEARVVPDIVATIVQHVDTLRAQVDYVFTTGGIGPTHDDKTALAMALAFNVALERNKDAWACLVRHYNGAENINEGRAKMADIPVGAALIDNPVSSAPGFKLENVYVMAGVPKIMQAMMEGLLPKLEGGEKVHARNVAGDIAESLLAGGLESIENAHEGVTVGSYPRFSPDMKPRTTIVVRGCNLPMVDDAAAQVADLMRSLGVEPRFPETE